MYKHKGCMNGTTLGHWLSQYGNKSDEHFSTYITEADIAKIAALPASPVTCTGCVPSRKR